MKKTLFKSKRVGKKAFKRKTKSFAKKKVPGALTVYPFKRNALPLEIKYSSGSMTYAGDIFQINSVAAASGLTNCYDLALGINFKLGNVQTPSDFTALFDRYCIHGVALKIMYDCNMANVTGTGVLPYITYAPDWDDSAAPSSEDALQQKQYAKVKILNGSKIIKYYLQPRIALATSSSLGTVTDVVAPKNTWLNCTQTTTAHNGFKAYIRNIYSPTGAQSMIRIQPTYYLRLKDSQ